MFALRNIADGRIDGSDATLTGGSINNAYARVYQASAIVGLLETATPVVAATGDSIAAGFNAPLTASYLSQALAAAGITYINLAMGSNQPGNRMVNATRRRRPFLKYANHALREEGINGVGTTWSNAKLYPGRVWQTTIGPQTTSTNSWADAAGQAVTANESVRMQLSDYSRIAPAPRHQPVRASRAT